MYLSKEKPRPRAYWDETSIRNSDEQVVLMMHPWAQLSNLRKAQVLLILPCNAAACIGNYFKADSSKGRKWNSLWREADLALRDFRNRGEVAFAAVDSSPLETEPKGSKGSIVFETEMSRVKNPTGKDWGAPSWRWFRPTATGHCEYLEMLTESLVKGVRRVESIGFSQVFALVNPRGYFLSLAAALDRCRLLSQWILFRVPAHPRHLLPALRQTVPLVRVAAGGKKLKGGIYHVPELYPCVQKENRIYKDSLPNPWQKHSSLPRGREINIQWSHLTNHSAPRKKGGQP